MALKVVGSGLGRSGTHSMKLALEQLGFAPCHHMIEVFQHPETVPLWIEAAHGRPDWDLIFKDYAAAVDYPSARYWRQLAEHYPDAKVLHTVRDPEEWFESTQATIFAPGTMAVAPPEPMKPFFGAITGDFEGRIHERAYMTDYFRRHSATVEAAIAPDRLLVYEAGEGWERLCAFLDVPVPDTPFPKSNTRDEFAARVAATRAAAPST
jgi:hypothetical protein